MITFLIVLTVVIIAIILLALLGRAQTLGGWRLEGKRRRSEKLAQAQSS